MTHADYGRGRQVAENILRTFPHFCPALNNLSQIYSIQGEIEKAIQIAQKVLIEEPTNIHAISNLARFYFLTGKPSEAQDHETSQHNYCKPLPYSNIFVCHLNSFLLINHSFTES